MTAVALTNQHDAVLGRTSGGRASRIWFAAIPYVFFISANIYDMGGTHGLKYISYLVLAFLIPCARVPLRLRIYEELGIVLLFLVWPACTLLIGLANGADFSGEAGALSQATPFLGFFVPLLVVPILGAQRVLVYLYYAIVVLALAIAIITTLEFQSLGMGFITQIPSFTSAVYAPYEGGIGEHRLYFQATLWLVPTAVYFAKMSRPRPAMLCLASLIMASSRSGTLIVLAVMLLILIKTPRYRASGLICLAIAVAVGIYFLPAFIQSTINAFLAPDSPSLLKRYGHAVSVIHLFIDKPWTIFVGSGAGATFYSSGTGEWEVRMETDHLDAIFHYGIIWFGAFTWLCVRTIRRLLRSSQANHKAHGLALLSMYFASGTNPQLISPLFMFYLCACLLMTRPLSKHLSTQLATGHQASPGIHQLAGATVLTPPARRRDIALKTAFIFVTWNSQRFIADSIGRLQNYVSPEDIMVVDNDSSDDTVGVVTREYPLVHVHRLPVNTGFSGGNNVGMRAAIAKGYDAVFLLNVDTIIDEDFVNPCLRTLEDHADVGVVGPVVLEADQENVIQCEGGRISPIRANFPYRKRGRAFDRRREIVDVGYVLGAAMMIRREVIERIGYLDEDYFPAYVEEADFCFRARKAGFRSCVALDAAIRHIGEQSSGGRLKANNRLAVHRFYFAIKHSGPAAFLAASIAIVSRAFYWKCRDAVLRA